MTSLHSWVPQWGQMFQGYPDSHVLYEETHTYLLVQLIQAISNMDILRTSYILILLLTTLTSGPNFCMIVAENAAPANNRR